MRRLHDFIQHCLNPLHLFCRLRNLGLATATARRLCACYERFFYGPVIS